MDKKYLALEEAIRDGDGDEAVKESLKLVDEGVAVAAIFIDCVEPVLTDIGDQFARLDIFLPELMIAADVIKDVQAAMDPILKDTPAENATVKKRAVIATVYGDVHDIGKNIVGLMLEVNGFEVKNLGVDISSNDIIKSAEDFNADLVCLSGLMMPSMPYMKDTIDMIKGNPKLVDRFKVVVGGGPVTEAWADEHGADGYADDAIGAVRLAKSVMGC
jgi:methanogenic corrinoid protein MtbC1